MVKETSVKVTSHKGETLIVSIPSRGSGKGDVHDWNNVVEGLGFNPLSGKW